jgi:putative ABC transport system substrate-binding protein
MRRRDFIKALAGTGAVWPVAVRAQQSDRMRRVGVLLGGSGSDDPDFQARTDTLVQALQQLGWIEGRNLQIDYRSSAGDTERSRKFAAELVALNPDLIVASGVVTVAPLFTAARVTLGAICLSSSSHFALKLYSNSAKPVALPCCGTPL